MQRLTFINSRGQEIVFCNTEPYLFWQIDGTGLAPLETIESQAAGQNGYTLHGTMFEKRVIKLTGHIIGKSGSIDHMFMLRRRLINACNPALGLGTIIYENHYGRWQIQAFCKNIPYTSKIRHVQTIGIDFECPSPLWQSGEASQISLAYLGGGLEFPLVLPGGFGNLGYQAIIDNDGDYPTPLEIYIGGGSKNPKVLNLTTGQFIKIEKDTNSYEHIYINTDPGVSTVLLVRSDGTEETEENAYGYLSHDSTLFSLARGRNVILYETEDENKKVSVRLLFRKLYVGV